jgi:endonuclease/exonuclease/phosphatase family metal-dependent hydrolase
MKQIPSSPKLAWKSILFISLVFLLFFQLVSDFIETVYTFGLLGTSIPPEIVSVLLFFSPALLLLSRRPLPRGTALALAGGIAVARAFEVTLHASTKMLAAGLGVGILFILIPLLFDRLSGRKGEEIALEMGAGLTISLSLSILLRALASGSDYSLTHSWAGWIFAGGLILTSLLLNREEKGTPPLPEPVTGGFGRLVTLSIGLLSALMVLYYAFVSPGVLARWSEVDYTTILLILVAVLVLFFAALSGNRLERLPKGLVLAGNLIFVAAGAWGILQNQTRFPAESSAYPIDQIGLAPWLQWPLYLMILLSPIVLIDFGLLAREIASRRPTPRALGGSFLLASLFFLLMIFAQVFTTVYDYIPVVGPWFRDRFWLVFLISGLGMVLPILTVNHSAMRNPSPVLRVSFLPAVTAALLLAAVWAVINSPQPQPPAETNTLRVLTYNIQQGYDQNGVRSYEGQLELIRSLNPDILGLQESDVARFSGGNADVVRTFAEGLDLHSYYGPKTVNGTFGIALLSRYPIENPRTFYMYSSGEQTAAIMANIFVNGTPYTILVTHLGNGGPMIQQEQVLAELDQQPNVIAMGDFNFDLETEQYALTRQSFESAWELAGSPAAPGLKVNHLIDHIFVSPGIKVLSAGYVVSPMSDHPALWGEIQP